MTTLPMPAQSPRGRTVTAGWLSANIFLGSLCSVIAETDKIVPDAAKLKMAPSWFLPKRPPVGIAEPHPPMVDSLSHSSSHRRTKY